MHSPGTPAASRPRASRTTLTQRSLAVDPPMSEEQRLLWLDLERSSDPCIYNEPCTLRCGDDYDHAAMVRSFQELTLRHEILRTSFASLESVNPVQIVHPTVAIDFPFHDLTALPLEDRVAEAERIVRADVDTPFSLTEAPLFRGRAFRIAGRDHRLYLTFHHIIFDGDSLSRLLIPELIEIYRANVRGLTPALKPVALQYGDYAVWQRDADTQSMIARQLGHWQARLAGELPVVELPVDRPRTAPRSGRGDVQTLEIGPDLAARLRGIGSANGASLYMVLLAAYVALLHRWSGQEDVVVGGLISTQRRRELRGTAGYFLNMLALRFAPAPDLAFTALLADVRSTMLDAMENADVPFGVVARGVSGSSKSGREGVFQAAFSMEPPLAPLPHGWQFTSNEELLGRVKFDFYLEVQQRADTLTARFQYSADLFDHATVRRLAGHFMELLRGIEADPDATLGQLEIMPKDEVEHVIAVSTGPRFYVHATTLHGWIERTMAERPEQDAVLFGEERWNYARLADRAEEIACALRHAGADRGAIVGLLVTRSADMIAAILGILRTGAAYLPLDPSFPDDRLRTILADARPSTLLSERALVARAGGTVPPDADRCAILALEDIGPPGDEPLPRLTPGNGDDLAYIIYTSGSTGVPKGVEIRHGSVVNVMNALRRNPGFGPDDRLLAVSRLTFDMSVPDVFLPLICGGTIVVAEDGAVSDPLLLATLLARHRCTFMQATPATWRAMLASGWEGQPGLRILCGGEALPRDLADRILDRGMLLWNGYGPTETTIYTTIGRVDAQAPISIGRPIDNIQAIILDTAGRPVPFNVPGELHIGGAGVARRYRDPALDARSFVSVPALGGGRFYRSGDVALMRRDGRVEWLGRRDGQIKIRGFRIDVGDIEAALLRHPDVAAAAVQPFEAASGLKELAAYVVMRPIHLLHAPAMRDFLTGTLPPYMVPSRYVSLAALPTTSSGKLDRNALPIPTELHLVEAPRQGEISGEDEERLAAIWADVLGLETIGAHDDFFDLGGHSLLAARMLGRVAQEFGARLPMAVLIQAATIRSLAEVLKRGGASVIHSRLVTVQGGEDEPPLFWIDAVPNFRQSLFRPLARALGPRQPLIGLAIDLARHDDLRSVDLGTLADDLAANMIASGAPGPFIVGGYCNGGGCALAVAHRLREMGHEVALVIMLDTTNQSVFRTRASRWRRDLRRAWQSRGADRIAFLREVFSERTERMRRRLLGARTDVARHLDVNDRLNRIMRDFDYPAYDGSVVLFHTDQHDVETINGWRSIIVRGLEVRPIAGGHITVLQQPEVTGLGQALSERIAQLERRSDPHPRAYRRA